MSYIELPFPIKTTPHAHAGETISAPGGFPWAKNATSANGPISAYGAPHIKLSTGGGGTVGGKQGAGNTGDDHVGDGNS